MKKKKEMPDVRIDTSSLLKNHLQLFAQYERKEFPKVGVCYTPAGITNVFIDKNFTRISFVHKKKNFVMRIEKSLTQTGISKHSKKLIIQAKKRKQNFR